MADPVTAITVVAGAAQGAKAYFQEEAANEKTKSIDLQTKQNVLQYQQKTLSNYDILQKVTATQLAQASTKGVNLNSPSFQAIQQNTLNTAGKQQTNLDIEENLLERNAKIEKENVKQTLYAQLFGDVEESAMAFAKLK